LVLALAAICSERTGPPPFTASAARAWTATANRVLVGISHLSVTDTVTNSRPSRKGRCGQALTGPPASGSQQVERGSRHDQATLAAWARGVGWEALLNRAGTTFRKLPDAEKEGLTEASAIALMLGYPSAIKRPVLTTGGTILVGFDPARYAAAFAR
jgi:arsenate reductase-like glutaredoxin family protein